MLLLLGSLGAAVREVLLLGDPHSSPGTVVIADVCMRLSGLGVVVQCTASLLTTTCRTGERVGWRASAAVHVTVAS